MPDLERGPTEANGENEWDWESLVLLRRIESVVDADLASFVPDAWNLQAAGEGKLQALWDCSVEECRAELPGWAFETRVLEEAVYQLIFHGEVMKPMRPEDARQVLVAIYLLRKSEFDVPPDAPSIMRLPWSQVCGEVTNHDLSALWRNRLGVYRGIQREFRDLVDLAVHAAMASGIDELRPEGCSEEPPFRFDQKARTFVAIGEAEIELTSTQTETLGALIDADGVVNSADLKKWSTRPDRILTQLQQKSAFLSRAIHRQKGPGAAYRFDPRAGGPSV